MPVFTIIFYIALVFSAIFHEYAHGWVALKLGDHTAKDAGRLTFNPIPHIDLFNTIILPALMLISTGGRFALGGAKPVPYNPYNLKDQKYGDLKVALAGPGINLILAIIFGLLARFLPIASELKLSLAFSGSFLGLQGSLINSVFFLSTIICLANLMLFVFNLIPIPPLDGSKIFLAIMPYRWKEKYYRIEPYGLTIIIILFLLGFFSFVVTLVYLLLGLMLGLN